MHRAAGNVGKHLGCRTYQNDGAAKDQVPQQVFLPVKLGVGCLKLTQVLEDEICIHHDAQLGPGEEEAGAKPPYLGRELEDEVPVEVEPLYGQYSEVAGNRRRKDSTRDGPAKKRG